MWFINLGAWPKFCTCTLRVLIFVLPPSLTPGSASGHVLTLHLLYYHSVQGKRPLPGKHPCTLFQGVNVAASIQTYGIYIPSKHPCGPKSLVMFKRPWALTWDTTVSTCLLIAIGFVMTPSSLNKTIEQGKAVFCCQHRSSDDITWRVNGTSISSHDNISKWRVPVGDGRFASFLSVATLPGFNNTTIECGAIFFDGSPLVFSPPVTLLIQGTCILNVIFGITCIILQCNLNYPDPFVHGLIAAAIPDK